jgi:hypothetical protein
LDGFTPRKARTKMERWYFQGFTSLKMKLVTKRNQKFVLPGNQWGQISIFFSASLVVFVSIIAFVINVGLFVKAKINLQNATDAAAFAGAAVQARQLTKVAYLNWEMRNIYKEWMYKYYVIGSLNVPMVEDENATGKECGGRRCSDFRLADNENAISGQRTSDAYNFPAVCLHIANSKTNVCKRFGVPGLPEFGGYSITGTEEASRAFIDALIGSKINDCVERSRLNMLVATNWAYNIIPSSSGDDTLAGRAPAILSDRQGAWPKAIEMAIRIRNLEYAINRVAITTPVCINGADGCDAITNYESEQKLGNERIVKAFYSGYRNLGNHIDNEMKVSFKLTELPPKKLPLQNQWSSSSLLIPSDQIYEKQFVDLRLMMVNLATFYAALIPQAQGDTSGECNISKVAIPVPGYPLGFYKNPEVLTYYAVRGEADFIGMFNPFSAEKIKLTAYAAAKPFGGRIGPMLFTQKPNQDFIRSRSVSEGKYRSVPYISALDVKETPNRFAENGSTLASGEFAPGAPLPVNVNPERPFWLEDPTAAIGGIASNSSVMFGIPNLVYDFTGSSDSPDYSPAGYVDGDEPLFVIRPASGAGGDKAVGLYNFELFKKFRGDLNGDVTAEMMLDQIRRVRAPTQYEMANYLIPTPSDFNLANNVDSFGIFSGQGDEIPTQIPGLKIYQGHLYAPLHKKDINQNDVLYRDSTHVKESIIEFMKRQKPAMDNYLWSLNQAAIQTFRSSSNASAFAQGATGRYEDAARKISDINVTDSSASAYTQFPESCDSLAGQFWHFYYGDPLFNDLPQVQNQNTCPRSLVDLLNNYFAASASDPNYDPYHYKFEFSFYEGNLGNNKLKIYSGYMPGPYNGVGADATLLAPPGFPQSNETMRRNFYSTKLISLDSMQKNGNYDEKSRNFVIHSEGGLSPLGESDTKVNTWINPLDPSAVNADLSSIKY